MVTAGVVIERFRLPSATLYWLVKEGKIRVHEAPREAWHKRRRLRFLLSEVQADLEKMRNEQSGG